MRWRTPDRGHHGLRLFYQIASRLVLVASLFAVLEVVIVVLMYVNDEETLSEDLISLESNRIADLLDRQPIPGGDGGRLARAPTRAVVLYDGDGKQLLLINPGHVPLPEAPLADVQSTTARELHGTQFFLTGIRKVELRGQARWLGLSISGEGLRPFVPALVKEVWDHALLPLIPLSLLLLVFNIGIVRRMLRPLERAMAEVDALDPADPGRRLHQPESPVEVSRLLAAVNRALGRVERAIEGMRQFTADAAHELRTPLAAMTLTIERLPATAERKKLTEDARAMARLVGQMLDLARADALDDMRRHRCSLYDMTSRVAAEMAPVAISMGRSVRYRDVGGATVEGRGEMLERAVRNLIENALAHTPPGTEVEVEVGPGPRVMVRDHGPGIPPAVREAVFERFWRADRQGSGAGLGLAITRKIIEACGGAIDIADAPGGGAQVSLVFDGIARGPTAVPKDHPTVTQDTT